MSRPSRSVYSSRSPGLAGSRRTNTCSPEPRYAPDLNPNELVWSYPQHTVNARRLLRSREHLGELVADQLADIGGQPDLVRSLFKQPTAAYIFDC